MKRFLLPTLVAAIVSACSSLPALTPIEPAPPVEEAACAAVFPRRPWRMVHAIQTDLPGRRKGVMLGVVALAPDDNAVESAILTIEGLRLFEARDDNGTLTVRRALPPFDRPGLAEGMMRDIRLLFFPPAAGPGAIGRTAKGEVVCRYALEDGHEDVVRPSPEEVVIRRYDGRGRLVRHAVIDRCHPEQAPDLEAVPCRIRLEAFRPSPYRLDMEIVEARPGADGRP